MITNAHAGGTDVIITKEVSRFARNILDAIAHTRELKENNVRVIFINDNIDTNDSDWEFKLALMSSFAQEESRKNSERTRWGMNRRMESGKVTIRDMYGYDVHDGRLTVNPEEAVVIRKIFHMYVYEHKGLRAIANELNESGALISKRIKRWTPQNISRILADEKFVGDLELKKYVTPNYLDHKQVKNDGIEEKIYHTDNHEPIIDRETWNLAKKEQGKRAHKADVGSKYSNRYWGSGKLKCAECGSYVVSRNKKNKDGTVIRFWYCREGYVYGKQRESEAGTKLGCNSNLIGDRALVECVKYALKHLCILDDDFLDNLYNDIVNSYDEDEPESIKPIEAKIARIMDKKNRALEWCLDGKIDEDEAFFLNEKHHRDITALRGQIAEIKERNRFIENAKENLESTLDAMRKIINQEESAPELYTEIIDRILLYKDHKLDIYFNYISEPVRLEYSTSSRGEHYKVECLLRQDAA